MASDHDINLTLRVFDQGSSKLSAFAAKMGALQKTGASFGAPIAKGFAGVGSAVGNVASNVFGLGARLAGLGIGASVVLGGIIHSAVEAGDKLGEMAQKTGLSVDAFASMRFAAEQADISQEEFATSMTFFTKQLGQAKAGTGGLLSFLNKVSPALGQQIKGAKSTEEALSLMTDALTRVTDPGKRAALAAVAFGKSGVQMGQFLGQGVGVVQAAQIEFMRIAGSQEQFAKTSGDLDNALKRSGTAFGGLQAALASKLFPAFTKLADGVTNFIVAHRDGLAKWAERTGAVISEWVDGGGLDRLADALGKVAGGIGSVLKWLGPMGTAMVGVGVLAAPLLSSVVGLGSALWTLGGAILPALTAAWSALVPALVPVALNFAAMAIAAAPFLLAAGGIALAGKAIYDNWGEIKMIFSDLIAEVERLGGVLEIVKNPLGAVSSFAGFVGRGFGGEGDQNSALSPEAQARAARFNAGTAKPFNAESARPALSSTNDARVSVSFDNLPRGARVTTDPSNSAPVSTDVGYSMAVP